MGRTAADEMDDLEAVRIGELGLGPAIAGDDAAVEFDGDAIGFHAEFFDESREGERAVEVARFAIDVENH